MHGEPSRFVVLDFRCVAGNGSPALVNTSAAVSLRTGVSLKVRGPRIVVGVEMINLTRF